MTDLTLIIGNKNYSSWSLRPWIFMKHMKMEFHEKRIPLFTKSTVQQLEPYFSNSKVPVLQDGELIVWDSLAIMEYLSGKYLDDKAWPSDETIRAIARSISAEMHSSFTNLRNQLPMNCRKFFPNFVVSDEVHTDIQRITSLWKHCRTQYGKGGDWLFGKYSIADAMFAPVVLRLKGYDVPLDGISRAYVQTTLDSPDLQRWIEAGQQETEIIEMDEVTIRP